jgi:hypothetical protein
MQLALMFGGAAILAIPGSEKRDRSNKDLLTKVLWLRERGLMRRRLCLCAILSDIVRCGGGSKRVPADERLWLGQERNIEVMGYIQEQRGGEPYIFRQSCIRYMPTESTKSSESHEA